MRRLISLAPWLLAISLGVPAAHALDESSAVDLVAPDPAQCLAEPRSLESMQLLLPTPIAVVATPEQPDATPQSALRSAGEPADAKTVAGVTATVNELFACWNGDEIFRGFALFTDTLLKRWFEDQLMTEQSLGFLGNQSYVRPPEARQAIAVQEVQLLADGRVSALVVGHNPETSADFREYVVLLEKDGRFLIDEIISLNP